MKKLKDLELKKLILELEMLDIEENYNNEFVSNYRPLFNEHLRKIAPEFAEKPAEQPSESPEPQLESEPIVVDEAELKKIKKIYKEISKICHPDKTNIIELNELYIQAKLLYEKNDLLGLIKISNKLSLNFEIEDDDVIVLRRSLKDKKEKLMKIEGTFLWIWANANTDEEKEAVIKMYVDQLS